MQFLTVTRRRTEQFTDAEFTALVEAEILQARALYGSGFIRQIWHRADIAGACILVEADNEDAARATLNTLPLFAAGMLEVSLIPLKPYAGFGPR
jgi:muconolactone delta-isomerase